nr:MAG TPA: hypothetical protein [Caudoviricetes sp.]
MRVIVDNPPKDCITCPLDYRYKKDCGKEVSRNYNGGLRLGKVPDKRCKLKEG